MKATTAAPVLAFALFGCGSFDIHSSSSNEGSFFDPGTGVPDPGPKAGFASPGEDNRPVQNAPTAPPPVTGGTLIITRDGRTAVAADPDRDRVSIVTLTDGQLVHTVALTPGDEPGRLVEDGAGRVIVALRRGGAIATIDLASGTILERRAVCGSPRGIAYDAKTDNVHVACSSGELVTFPAATGDAIRRVRLDVDLRDVIVKSDGVYVSRFKSAELLRVGDDGVLAARFQPTGLVRMSDPTSFTNDGDPIEKNDTIEPAGAWRTVASPTGDLVMLHQYALAMPIVLPKDPAAGDPGNVAPPPLDTSQPYGGGVGTCGGLVQASVSRLDANGTMHMGAPLVAPVLSVDAAVSPDGKWIALAEAGARDPNAGDLSGGFSPPFSSMSGTISIVDQSTSDATTQLVTCLRPSSIAIDGQPTAVAFNPGVDASAVATNTWLVVQSREPAKLVLFHDVFGSSPRTVDLGGVSEYDTGHELFHRDAGAGIACASCHLEGGEDGRVWQFDPIGNRRTQAVHVGLQGTEPFHWDGDMHDFNKLIDEVMVRRMGGLVQSAERKTALQGWLFSLRPPAPIVAASDVAAQRGRTLFQSSNVGCTTCHAGEKFTSNLSVEVGTTEKGHKLQVPSLHGVGFRAPFLHDGCAATLQDRFNPSCGGGDTHGHTSQLNDGQVDDLVAYLESL